MLNLSRRVGESILIGEDIVITILAVKGKQVRIGLSAPAGITILREEIAPKLGVVRDDGSIEPADGGGPIHRDAAFESRGCAPIRAPPEQNETAAIEATDATGEGE